jgi:AraC family transcriptional regulator, regulatory protein of adaptative response / methylated-DNA-[protein]-cysteine methyltransferase
MSDYDRIARAIFFIINRANSQPTLDEIAAHVHLSPYHFQRLFSRWAGVSPKRFLQVLTVERAKELLRESQPLLEVSYSVGLSSGSRLYDHFVQLEAVTPGEFKTGGESVTIEYAVHDTPFGQVFIGVTDRGICSLQFLDNGKIDSPLKGLYKKWPCARLFENRNRTSVMINSIFNGKKNPDRPLSLYVTGTNFQVNVWKALLRISPGKVASYSQVASAIGHPNASRAVGLAVGHNPVAFLVPCHRVIQQSGKLGGYHWGETRKHAMLAWEEARHDYYSP